MKVYNFILRNTCIVIIFLSTGLFAQMNITTELLTVRDGLSNNQVRDIVQDKYGYMWFTTADGVNMYDGYKITVFKNIPGDTTSLPANVTFNVYEDKSGTLWIGTDEGLARFNRNSKTFTNYKFTELNEPTSNRVINFCEDIHGKLWVATISGTYEFDRNKNEFKSYDIMKTDNTIVKYLSYGGIINANSNGALYNICSTYGLLKFDYDAELFVQLDLKENFNGKFTGGIYFAIEFDKDNNVWLALSRGLFKYDILDKKVYDITPFKKRTEINEFLDNAARDLFRDNNNMWVGTGLHGVYLFDVETNTVEQVIKPASAVSYQGFYRDNSGLLWFGSSRGVSKIDFDRKPFESYTFEKDSEESPDNRVFSFIQTLSDKENILLGTPLGIKIFNNENKISSINDSKFNSLSKLNSMIISDFADNKNDILWIGTDDNGLWSYDLQTGNLKNYLSKLYDDTSLISNRIHFVSIDADNNLWIGTNLGLQILNFENDRFTNVYSLLNRNYNPDLINLLEKLREEATPISSSIEVGNFADLTKEFVVRKDVKALIYATGEGLPRANMVDYGWLESENGDTLWSAANFYETFHTSGDFKNRIKMGHLDLKAGRYKLRYISDDSHSAQSYNRLPPQDSTYWGAQIFELNEEDFIQAGKWIKQSDERTYLTGEYITSIFKDSQKNMWVGTNDGLSKIDSTLHVENYLNIPTDNNSLSSNNVRSINEDSSGNIWIATRNGLNKFNRSQKSFLQIWERDGLPSSNLSSIEVDEQGHLWVSGLKGISKIELNKNDDNFIIVNYDVKDGLQGYEFCQSFLFRRRKRKALLWRS
jgi:ligand-binding sensor domain-containing protein